MEEKFLDIIEEHKGLIYSLCKVYHIGVEDRSDAYQDVVTQLWSSFTSFRSESSPGTWIYKVALHTLLNQKRKKRIIKAPFDEFIEASYSIQNSHETKNVIDYILASLTDLDKAIVVLYLEGYDYQEIGSILQMKYSAVSTRMYRIKNSLSKKLKNGTLKL